MKTFEVDGKRRYDRLFCLLKFPSPLACRTISIVTAAPTSRSPGESGGVRVQEEYTRG